jgi:hypothetical protein
VIAVTKRRDTIPITGRLDGQAHDVTDQNVVAGQGTGGYEAALVTSRIHAWQFGNSPDSGRPLVEQFPRPIPAPGGRPDTTTPVDSASLTADVDRGDRPFGGREQQPHTRYEQLQGAPWRTGLRVPDPQFPHKTPAGRRSGCSVSLPALGGQLDPRPQTARSSVGRLRWARCPDDGRLHLLRAADVGGHAQGPVRSAGTCGGSHHHARSVVGAVRDPHRRYPRRDGRPRSENHRPPHRRPAVGRALTPGFGSRRPAGHHLTPR